MREDVEFSADGVTLRGWLFLPDESKGDKGSVPCVVMAHGFSGLKEQTLDDFAEVFRKAGLAVLVYDHRNFGASDGEPRQEIDPWVQIRDYRHAITYAQTRSEIDPERIGIWGTSFSGGHVLVVGAIDSRVKCVVSQVPTISGSANALRRVPPHMRAQVDANFNAERMARFKGEAPKMVPAVSEDPGQPCAVQGQEAYDFFVVTAKERGIDYVNQVTMRSMEMGREYEPGDYVARISPTPLLMIVAFNDTTTPADLALQAFERALSPKHLVTIPGGHFDPYIKEFETVSRAATEWFTRHLL